MPDMIGNIPVPTQAPVGTFPLILEFGFTQIVDPQVFTHQFRAGNITRSQRYYAGPPARRFAATFEATNTEVQTLKDFWEAHNGTSIPFTLNIPNIDNQTFIPITACFANQPLDIPYGQIYSSVTVNFIEILAANPSYVTLETVIRFPDSTLATALTEQAQQMIKLIKIEPRKVGYPAIYLSDQRCVIDGQQYLPRLLRWEGIGQVACGLPGIGTESDNVTLVFGNADRVMRMLADDVMLDMADVSCMAYHVGSKVKINLWKGTIVPGGWASNVGPEFTINCSDPIASPFIVIPPRVIDRLCNKQYDDGVECPYSSVGSLDPVNYPGADATFCDKGFKTANGCLAHNMTLFYNGIIATPQSVYTKDNSGGLWGLFRSALVSSSIISDSAYGQPLPIIITDIPFPVAGIIIAGRDEGDFYQALVVVGQGPMDLAPIGHTVDGQYNHGYPATNIGLHVSGGFDPALSADVLSMDAGGVFQDTEYSAGTAYFDLRRKDASGLQLTTLDQHAAQAIVNGGLRGFAWTAPGVTEFVSLTNPVWLAANMLLLAKKLMPADTITQEEFIDVDSCMAAAAICDLAVTRVVELDEGLETQWKFIGVISDRRPLRDWLADILLNCLGYYTFIFGKLSIGVRENASAVSAYTDGNIIWKSIQLSPIGPQFTKIVATFADREYGFVGNTASYQDDDLATLLGGGDRPQHQIATMNLCGTADISPASRFAVTRGREEVGGVNDDERKVGRRIVFKTTALGFDTAPGMVISVTNDELPTDPATGNPGFQHFRVERWKLANDWSIEISGRYVTASMYDLVQGPKPADVRPSAIPGQSLPTPLTPAWMPNNIAQFTGDVVYTDVERFFSIVANYYPRSDGSNGAKLLITGETPVNGVDSSVKPNINNPAIATTGGFLKGGRTLYLTVAAFDSTQNDLASMQSNAIEIIIPTGTDTNTITIPTIVWPAQLSGGGNWDSFAVYAAYDNGGELCQQGPITSGQPTSITLLGPLELHTVNPPSYVYQDIGLKAKEIHRPGMFGQFVTSVPSSTEIVCDHIQGLGDDWTGRVVTLYGKADDSPCPVANFLCTAYDDATGKFTLDPPPAGAFAVGDVLLVRYAPTFSDVTVSDPLMINGQWPLGLVGDDSKQIIRIVGGPGRGQWRTISSNTSTAWTIDAAFDATNGTPDSTSIIIIEEPSWTYNSECPPFTQTVPGKEIDLSIEVSNLILRPLLVMSFIRNTGQLTSDDSINTLREMYLYGSGGLPSQAGFGVPKAQFLFGGGTDSNAPAIYVGQTTNKGRAISAGECYTWNAKCDVADPTGVTIDILKNGVSILGVHLISIPATSTAYQIGDVFDGIQNIAIGDELQAVIISCDASTPAKSLSVYLYYGLQVNGAISTNS